MLQPSSRAHGLETTPPSFALYGAPTPGLEALAQALAAVFETKGYTPDSQSEAPRAVLNFIQAQKPTPYRRKAQGTMVISFLELSQMPQSHRTEVQAVVWTGTRKCVFRSGTLMPVCCLRAYRWLLRNELSLHRESARSMSEVLLELQIPTVYERSWTS